MTHKKNERWQYHHWFQAFPPDGASIWCHKMVYFNSAGNFHSRQYPNGITLRLITKGTGWLETLGNHYTLRKGCLFLAMPGTLINMGDESSSPWEWWEYQLSGPDVPGYLNALKLNINHPVINVKINKVLLLLKKMLVLFESEHKDNYKLISYLYEILSVCGAGNAARESVAHDNTRQTVEIAKSIIHSQVANNININDVCKQMKISRSTLLRYFNEHENLTPVAYLQLCKLKNAEKLLVGTDLPIKEIAHNCGYNTDKHFINSFTKSHAISPNSWRKKNTQL